MKHKVKGQKAFSLIEVIIALFILAFIATTVSQIQFTSLFKLSSHHERLKAALRTKKELVTIDTLQLYEKKLEPIHDEKEEISIKFSIQNITSKSSLSQISGSLKKITAQTSWEVFNQKDNISAALICYSPEEGEKDEAQ